MIDAGVYSLEDIEEICSLERRYAEECDAISMQCVEEGYPSNGSNYDIRCGEARKWYNEEIRAIDEKYSD
jgi:hypothetical protein